MKYELKQNIEASAAEVRSAKGALESAIADVKACEDAKKSLLQSMNALEEQSKALVIARCKAIEKLDEASDRYTFYCKEAIEHPY